MKDCLIVMLPVSTHVLESFFDEPETTTIVSSGLVGVQACSYNIALVHKSIPYT